MKSWLIILIILIFVGVVYAYNNPQILTSIKNNIQTITPAFTSIGDILKNPEKYENNSVIILGKYTYALLGSDEFLVDDQGYQIRIDCKESSRTFNLGEKYKATGIVTFNLICDCQERYVLNVTEDDWKQLLVKYPKASKQNASTYIPGYLIFPEPEEGWFSARGFFPGVFGKTDASTCNKRELFSEKESFEININETHRGRFSSEVIAETMCKSATTEKIYYFKCTEPMIKV